jgi:hypothetical protein
MNKKMFLALALVFGINYGVLAQGQDQHIRFLPGNTQQDGELQIAVTEYTRPGVAPNTSATRVILYGVVHVADQNYYNLVQRDLDSYDEVLYEGVKQGSTPNPGTKGLNAIQKLMGDVLGLTFQKDGINYNRTNFVHADVDIDRLRRQMGPGQSIDPLERYVSPEMLEQLGPFLDLASEFIKMYMQSNPGMQDQLKVQFGNQLASTDISAQLSPAQKRAILDDRNQLVEEVLTRQLQQHPEHKTFAIFYRAAHMPDFELRLQRMGFTRSSQRWMTAWSMGQGATRARKKSQTPKQGKKQAPKREKSKAY